VNKEDVMKVFLMILVSCMLIYATEPVKKAPVPVKNVQTVVKKVTIISYEQQVKNVQSYYNQQMSSFQKTKSSNDAIIIRINNGNQRLSVKEDSIKTVVREKLQYLFDAELKKIQIAQDSIDSKRAEIDRINKDAISILPK
jgi:cell division protein FtsX